VGGARPLASAGDQLNYGHMDNRQPVLKPCRPIWNAQCLLFETDPEETIRETEREAVTPAKKNM